MIHSPVIEQNVLHAGSFLLSGIVGDPPREGLPEVSRLANDERRFVVHAANSGFDILEDIDRVTDFALEPNIFFAPRFLVPAMSRLDERQVHLMLLQDGSGESPETRFLMPFSIEKPGFAIGPDVIRAWANPFGPYGAPLVERREATRTLEDLVATLGDPDLPLPKVLVLPDVMMSSPAIAALRGVAIGRGLPVTTTGAVRRPFLESGLDSVAYFKDGVSGQGRRNLGRHRRQLEALGAFEYEIARSPKDVRVAMEEFLLLENAGWKGRQRTSLAADRFRAAFAREAINNLAERDLCRIHSFKLDGRVIASLIVFVQAGHAWTWKTTYDEALANHSPGTLLILQVTETHLDDPNIQTTDSCAAEDHPVMTRIWSDTREFATMVVGLRPDLDRETRQVTSQIELYRSTRNVAKSVRDRLKGFVRKR
ncbi:GNAT family N-acetyltransferase [Oricola cellulosilytica]|uniref:GNAT family N-acetyltransferase n=1 Tax=Oricola cellulosilytica TaxID=1429082 RepID=A0A4R0PC06_9HYPH|nr:GNAT family N-acetyltransferase [Oricola cellulosilytica]TCD13698.1 GNAT family N-acetyltransferase [Oricola cellulosilytica]